MREQASPAPAIGAMRRCFAHRPTPARRTQSCFTRWRFDGYSGTARVAASCGLLFANWRMGRRLVGVEEAARHLGLSTSTVYKRAERCELPSVKEGGRLLFRMADLDAYADLVSAREARDHIERRRRIAAPWMIRHQERSSASCRRSRLRRLQRSASCWRQSPRRARRLS